MPLFFRLIIIAAVALLIVKLWKRRDLSAVATGLLVVIVMGVMGFALLVRSGERHRQEHWAYQREETERNLLNQKLRLEAAMARLADGAHRSSIELGEKATVVTSEPPQFTILTDGKRVFTVKGEAEISSDEDIQDVDSIMDEFEDSLGEVCEDCADGACPDCNEVACEDCETDEADVISLEEIVNQHPSDLYEFVQSEIKPDWIYDGLDTSSKAHTMVVTVGPYESERDLLAHFDDDLLDGVRDYADWHLKRTGKHVAAWYGPAKLQIPKKPVRERIIDAYDGVHLPAVEGAAPMPVKYVKLAFDSAFRDKIIDIHWQQSHSLARMIQTGLVSLGILGIVGFVFVGLKAETLTRGKHPKLRSWLAAMGVAMVAVLALSVLYSAIR